jgi:hypothetical protein
MRRAAADYQHRLDLVQQAHNGRRHLGSLDRD